MSFNFLLLLPVVSKHMAAIQAARHSCRRQIHVGAIETACVDRRGWKAAVRTSNLFKI